MSKLVVITGVSQGLGRAMTEQFIELGHTVIGCARNEQAIEQLKKEFGEPHNFAIVDVTNEARVQAWSEEIRSIYSPPDILINNAGFAPVPAPLWAVKSEEFNKAMDVNIKGVANVIRHFVPAMVQRNSGVIINISSGLGRYTKPNVVPYATTKWAIEGMTRGLAQELPSGMAAIPLWPGAIQTLALEIFYGKEVAKNYITPQKWAKTAVPYMLQIGPSDNGKPLITPTG